MAKLIQRHIDFVHAAALRQVKDPALAEDVTQAVFIILVRKAETIRAASFVGWLFNTTRRCAANARRSERRRRLHERQAAKPEVQMQPQDSAAIVLDDALAALRSSDRQVVLLRYMQQCEFSEVGSILGISEQTARRRLSRAVERLRHLLSAAGFLLPAVSVSQILSTTAPKAPAHLLASTVAAASATTTGAAAALASQTIRMLTALKLKIAATILLALTVAGVGAVSAVRTMSAQAAVADSVIPPVSPAISPQVAAGVVARFSDGSRIELIGVAPSPADGQQWWKPDGSPLAEAPYPHSSGFVTSPGETPYEFAVRLTGFRNGWGASVSVPGSGATSIGYPRPDILASAVALKPAPSTTVDFFGATGPWQIRVAVPASTVFAAGVIFNGVSFSPGVDPENASIRITADDASLALVPGVDRRIIAIGFNGVEHNPTQWSSNETRTGETIDLSFSRIRPEQIKEFQIRTRVFNRSAEFQNVSLIPGQLTPPKVHIHDAGGFVGNFTAGGSVEVVGLTDWPPTGKWWQPDGSALDQTPPDYGPYLGRDAKPGERGYAIAVRYINPQNASPAWSWTVHDVRDFGVMSGNRPVPAGSPDVYRIILPAGKSTADFRVGLAAGDWHKWATVIPGDAQASVQVDNTQISFSPPGEENGDVLITTVDNLRADALHDVQRQLIAVDNAGIEHVARTDSMKESAAKYTFRIPQITKARINSFRLETRQYEYVEFQNLSLQPNRRSDVAIRTDAPPIPATPQPGDEGI